MVTKEHKVSTNEQNPDLEKMAKDHNMSVEEFKTKSGLIFEKDGSHYIDAHTPEMISKKYSDAEIKDLAKQHDMSVEDMKKHIDFLKNHA